MKTDEKGKKLANDILDYVNNLACDEETFANTICHSHRTLQQSTMRLFITTICKMAENDTDEGACCGLYSKGTPSTDCHCETCEERGAIEDDC